MGSRKVPGHPLKQAAKIALLYGFVAFLWITFSDVLLGAWVKDAARLTELQTLKGWGFVAFTGIALFFIARRYLTISADHAQRYAEQRAEVRQLGQFRESIIDNASIWINVLDPQANITVWNKAAEQISGYRRDEVMGNSKIWEWLYPDPGYRAHVTAKASEILEQGAEVDGFETRIRSKDGRDKIIAWNSRRFFSDTGEMIGSIAIGRDITARKHMELALVERERQLATLMGNLPGLAYRCRNDEYWTMLFVSSGCNALTGYEPEELIDNAVRSYASLIHPDDLQAGTDEVNAAIAEKRPFAMEYRIRRKDGGTIWVWEQGRAVVEDDSLIEGIIMDITDRKLMEQELAQLAIRDSLTGLYNRRELERRFKEEFARASRYDRPLSLLWIDVDHFKTVNDQFGHHVGDEVLRQLSSLLEKDIRHVDYVARYGGEELVIVLPEMAAAEAMRTAERIRKTVGEARIDRSEGEPIRVSVSIGVAGYPDHGKSAEDLFRAADRAMYEAKQAGRNCVRAALPTVTRKDATP